MAERDAVTAFSENQWLGAARAGDEVALGQLLESCRQYLLLVANKKLSPDVRPKVAASDLVQETFVRAQEAFARFHGQDAGELRAWLRCILLRCLAHAERDFRDTAKRELAREVPFADLSPNQIQNRLATPEPTPCSALIARETDARLQKALLQLPADYQQVITWRNYDRLPFDEIGQRLSRSGEAARKLWSRAIQQLGKLLQG